MTRHTRSWKESEVEEIKKLASEYNIVGIANLDRFPADLFQELRKKLHAEAVIKVSKTSIIKRAFEQSNTKKLNEFAEGSIALIFTKMNPFELAAFIKKNKGSMSAKSGMTAPEDIMVPAGDTGLPPGPALSDLKGAGLKTKIEGATIAIAEDTIVVKKGELINTKVANALGKLEIKPIKIGLNIVAVKENDDIFKGAILDIDTEQLFDDFTTAHRNAFNLAFDIAYFTPQTIVLLIQKASREAKTLSTEASILNKETIPELLSKANAQASALKSIVKEEAPAAEEKKEEKPQEEKEKTAGEKEKPQEEKEKTEEKKEEPQEEKEKAEEKKEVPEKEKIVEEKEKAGEKEKAEEKKEEPQEEKEKAKEAQKEVPKQAEQKTDEKKEVKEEKKEEK